MLAAAVVGSLLRQVAAVAPDDSEQARRYSPAMARCMAAISKLSYCHIGPDDAGTALKEVCDNVCQWAGLELEPGSRLVGPSTNSDSQLDFGLIVKFKRGEEANEESLPAQGCIVVLRGTVDEDEGATPSINDIVAAPLAPVAPDKGRRLDPVSANSVMMLAASEAIKDRQEVWESDSVCRGCKVSAAYKAVWDGLRPRVFDHLVDAECKPGAAVFVTGHSAGAALATLAMFSLQAQGGYHVQTSYQFESPRIGNTAFVSAFHRLFEMPVSVFRITHSADRVTREPRRRSGYSHVGFQVWYKGDDPSSNYVMCGNATADPKCGVDGIPWNETCPLKQSECHNQTCPQACKAFAPRGGPHCLNPLAPGKSFCGFDGNRTENWGSEWNEVLTSGLSWERSCSWGRAPPTTTTRLTPPPTTSTTTQERRPASLEADSNVTTEIQQEITTTRPLKTTTSRATPPPKAKPTEKPEVPLNPCYQKDVAYQPLDMVGHYFSTESSAAACQLRCAGISGCEHFSFFMLDANNGDCHVAGETAVLQNGSKGFVAGPRSCEHKKPKEKKYLQFLGSQTWGPAIGPGWYYPGLAAACVLLLYFMCMAALAYVVQRRPSDARSAATAATPGRPDPVQGMPAEAAVPMMSDTDPDASAARGGTPGSSGY